MMESWLRDIGSTSAKIGDENHMTHRGSNYSTLPDLKLEYIKKKKDGSQEKQDANWRYGSN